MEIRTKDARPEDYYGQGVSAACTCEVYAVYVNDEFSRFQVDPKGCGVHDPETQA